MNGIQLEGDPYSLKMKNKFDREKIKTIFLIAINCQNRRGTVKAVSNTLQIPGVDINMILDGLLEKHS